MNQIDLEELVKQDIIAKVISTLPDEQKNEIVARGVIKLIENFKVSWEVEKIVQRQAFIFAEEYVKQPEVAQRLRVKAREAVDKIIDSIVIALAKEMEDGIKSKYVRILSEKIRGEV